MEGGAGAEAAKGIDGASKAEEAPGGKRAKDEEEGGDKERAATSKQKFLMLVRLRSLVFPSLLLPRKRKARMEER